MSTETLYPDGATFTLVNLTGAYTTVDDDPETSASDSDYLVATDQDAVTAMLVSFPTPTANPTTGTGVQIMRLRLRLTKAEPQNVNWEIREGTNVRQSGSLSVTSTSFAAYSIPWDAANLGTADGSLVALYVVGGAAVGTSRHSWECSALAWYATYSSGVVEQGKPLLFWCG